MRITIETVLIIVVLVFGCFATASAGENTREYRARAIKVLNNSATMRYQNDYFVTSTTGVVGNQGIPGIIRLGDNIEVGDQSISVKHIFVTQCLVQMEYAGEVFCERGQVSCVVVERLEDVPSDNERDRLWITVEHCKPIG